MCLHQFMVYWAGLQGQVWILYDPRIENLLFHSSQLLCNFDLSSIVSFCSVSESKTTSWPSSLTRFLEPQYQQTPISPGNGLNCSPVSTAKCLSSWPAQLGHFTQSPSV